MEILTTAVVESKTLTLEQTINLPAEGKFVTIKELFSIDGEIYVSIINHQTPLTLPNTEILVNRIIMSVKYFVSLYSEYL
jgi:hypothetical protein